MTTLTRTASDLAADSPLSLDELRQLNTARQLAPRLAAMSSRERIGAAALLAEATGRDISSVLGLFGRLMDEAAAPNHSATPADVEQINRELDRERRPSLPYRPVQSPSGEWVTPQWGVLYGGQGVCLNKHFATLAEAEAFYAAEIASVRQCFGKTPVRETETLAPAANITKQTVIVNVKKDGTTGKMRQTIRIYAITIPGFPSATVAEAEQLDDVLAEAAEAAERRALAEQLIVELNQVERQAEAAHVEGRDELAVRLRDAYDTLSARIRTLGYDIGPATAGGLCLYDKTTQRPLVGAQTDELTLPAMARCIWRFGGTAAALRGYLALIGRAA